MNKNKCIKCENNASYHDKLGQVYCETCYWEKDEATKQLAKNRSWKTYDSAPDTFIKCPYCFCGDTCGYAGGGRKGIDCIGQHNDFFHPEGNCSTCSEAEQNRKEKQREQAKETERKQLEKKYEEYGRQMDELGDKLDKQTFTYEDYRQFKQLLKNLEKLTKECERKEEYSIHADILKDILKTWEKDIPEQVKTNYQTKKTGDAKYCSHRNISWDNSFELFKEKPEKEPYCLDCGENEDKKFTETFQKWYCRKVEKWLISKRLSRYHFYDFLEQRSYHGNWQDLKRGKFFDNIKEQLSIFKPMMNYIEKSCLEFAQQEENKKDKIFDNKYREREREVFYRKNFLCIKINVYMKIMKKNYSINSENILKGVIK